MFTQRLVDYAQPGVSMIAGATQHVHQFVPMRTERLQQDGRTVEITTDVYCTECGNALHLELGK